MVRVRRDLFQELDPFAALCAVLHSEAGEIAVRACQAGDEAAGQRIGDLYEYDGDCPSLTGKSSYNRSRFAENDIWPQANELIRECLDPRGLTVTPAKLELERCHRRSIRASRVRRGTLQ